MATMAGSYLMPSPKDKKESYIDRGVVTFTAFAVVLIVLEIVFYVLLGSGAAYLSWTSNSSIGWHPIFCVLFAIMAFVFSGTYIFSHVLFKLDLLSALTLLRRASKAMVVQPPRNSNASVR